jgi:glycosyltransferase involved in cell wall biosynthesis
MDISEGKVAIATHYLIYGAPQALRDYLIQKKAKKVLFIAHPLRADGSRSYYEIIESGKVKEKKNIGFRTKRAAAKYPLELALTVARCIRGGEKYDLFVGVDSLNALAGLVLKKLGKVRKVVYYTIDYVPERFEGSLLNAAYHKADSYCATHCDEVWNVSERIAEAREKYQGISRKKYPQKVVPIGVWPKKVRVLPFSRIKRHRLLFVGHLLEKQGVQYVLDALPEISRKIPDFEFLVVGGGEYENELKKQAKRLGVEDRVTFTGWVKERKKIDSIMADSAIAIAMYQKYDERGNLSFTYFADPTKVKDYLSAGLPVIMTDVAHNAREIERAGCGKVIRPDKGDVARAVVGMMKDCAALRESRAKARKYALLFSWEVIFQKALGSA